MFNEIIEVLKVSSETVSVTIKEIKSYGLTYKKETITVICELTEPQYVERKVETLGGTWIKTREIAAKEDIYVYFVNENQFTEWYGNWKRNGRPSNVLCRRSTYQYYNESDTYTYHDLGSFQDDVYHDERPSLASNVMIDNIDNLDTLKI